MAVLPQMFQQYRNNYHPWIDAPKRDLSPEIDFGVWWKLESGDPSRWRVSWVADTGELYAKDQSPESNCFLFLGHFPGRKAIEQRMIGWAEGGLMFIAEWFASELSLWGE